jgi:hypothetical protein
LFVWEERRWMLLLRYIVCLGGASVNVVITVYCLFGRSVGECCYYRILSILIRTSFCRFLKEKKKFVRGSNPHLSFNRPLPTRQTDCIILAVTNALTVIRLTRRVWSGHLRNCQRYKRTAADKRCGYLNASYIHVEAQNYSHTRYLHMLHKQCFGRIRRWHSVGGRWWR